MTMMTRTFTPALVWGPKKLSGVSGPKSGGTKKMSGRKSGDVTAVVAPHSVPLQPKLLSQMVIDPSPIESSESKEGMSGRPFLPKRQFNPFTVLKETPPKEEKMLAYSGIPQILD